MSLEKIILSNLIYNENYARKILPYIKQEYFENVHSKTLFSIISFYIEKYNRLPSKEAIFIDLSNFKGINDNEFEQCKIDISELEIDSETAFDWLVDETEKWCQDRAMYLGLLQSLAIYEGKDQKLDRAAIPQIMTDAISVSFDSHIGHNFLEDAEKRYNFYHDPQFKTAFHIDILNNITKGGVSSKSLTIFMAGPGVGKSQLMCDFAANNLLEGKNVLYITLEMAEEKIGQRIDENLLDLNEDDLLMLSKDFFLKKIENIRKKTVGKLIIKEYPTGGAGSANFRALLRELKIKNNFTPDIIYIDYLNICASSRIKRAGASLYEYMKTVGEELRGLGVEFGIPIITATQFNREGFKSSDPGMEDIAESFGNSFTADLMIAIISSEEMERLNQIMLVQIKNRYNDVNKPKRFKIGIDRSKMKCYNLPSSDQDLTDQNKSDFEKKEPFITPEMERQMGNMNDIFGDFK